MCWGHLPPFHRGLEALNRPLKYQALNDPPVAARRSPNSNGCRASARATMCPLLKVSLDGSFGGE